MRCWSVRPAQYPEHDKEKIMSTSAIILAILLSGGVMVVTLLPLFARDRDDLPGMQLRVRGTDQQNRVLETLYAEKARALRAIRDLDFDFDMDKLTTDMYVVQREDLVHLAVAIIRRIDALESEILTERARVDAAVAAFRQGKHQPTKAHA